MKALAVVSPPVFQKIEDRDKYVFSIDNIDVLLGFIDIPKVEFDRTIPQNADSVLVKKTGFSLNYRDLALMRMAWGQIGSAGHDCFYPIGSDFAGFVEAVGENVTAFEHGELVIANSSFPEGDYGSVPGIPSNHSSREYEIFHFAKLMKVPPFISPAKAGAIGIGTQTAASMVRKAAPQPGDNILVTSVTSNTAFFLLNALWDERFNVYGLSFSGSNTERVKKQFPFIREIFSVKARNIPSGLFFDVVLDAFADTYVENLTAHLNMGGRYVTCGIYNQSLEKLAAEKPLKASQLIAGLIVKNGSLIANCLGTTQDLKDGLAVYEHHDMAIERIFTRNDSLEDFIKKTFNAEQDKFGKVVYQYEN